MNVITYRLQLFKQSEGFIAAQARALPTTSVLMMGRRCYGPPDGALPFYTPNELNNLSLASFMLTSTPQPFLLAAMAHRPHLVHAHFSIDGLYALSLARRLKVPLVTTLHGFDVTTSTSHLFRSGRISLIRYALLKKRLREGGHRFLCVSKYIYEQALRAGFPKDRMTVHYIGVDTDGYSPQTRHAAPRIVHIARLVQKKGTRYLIQAVSLLRKRHPDLVVDVIGDGPLKQSLMDMAAELSVRDHFKFHGSMPNKETRAMLSGAAALVLPSVTADNGDAEGLGIVLLEAAASGVPVVATRHGGIPEAVVHGETGFLVPEKDSNALSGAILRLVEDEGRWLKMSDASCKMVREKFDIRQQSALLERFYASL